MAALRIPTPVREQFEERARQLYGEEGGSHALVQAIELWLTQPSELVAAAEESLNNQAYEQLKPELEHRYPDKCVVIAHGALQGAGDTFEAVKDVALTAMHRLVFRVGDVPPRERELGWQIDRG